MIWWRRLNCIYVRSEICPYEISIDRPGDDWKYSSGFINAEMIEKSLFAPSEDNLVSSNHGQNTFIDYRCYKVFWTLLAILLLPIIRCWCAVHLLWSTSPASPTWTSWATASTRDSPTRRCVTASRPINAFQPPLRIFWNRASWTIMCSLGREHFIPLTPPACDHAIYLSIICINIPGVLSKRKHDFDTEQSLFFSAKSRFSIAYKLVLNL